MAFWDRLFRRGDDRAAGILYRVGDSVLLVLRAPTAGDFPMHWGLVGGHIDDGETPEQVLEARIALGGVRYHHRKIVELVSDAHCGDCGAHESEPCAETCGEKMTEGA